MIDHVSADGRLAQLKPVVTYDMPSWTLELVLCLVLLMAGAVLWALSQAAVARIERSDAQQEAEFWREFALAPETRPTVRVTHSGQRFECSSVNVPREWELAIAAECEVFGGLLQAASTFR